MKASKVIKRLQRRIDIYGDWDVVFRADGGELDPDADIFCIYADEDAEKIVVSDVFDPLDYLEDEK